MGEAARRPREGLLCCWASLGSWGRLCQLQAAAVASALGPPILGLPSSNKLFLLVHLCHSSGWQPRADGCQLPTRKRGPPPLPTRAWPGPHPSPLLRPLHAIFPQPRGHLLKHTLSVAPHCSWDKVRASCPRPQGPRGLAPQLHQAPLPSPLSPPWAPPSICTRFLQVPPPRHQASPPEPLHVLVPCLLFTSYICFSLSHGETLAWG